MLINGKDIPRFEVEIHGENVMFGCRVVDNLTGETHGFGMNPFHAIELAALHDVVSQSKDA